MYHNSSCNNSCFSVIPILRSRPGAVAEVKGGDEYPSISGVVRFYRSHGGVIVYAIVGGLPRSESVCQEKIFGFHIHEGTDCGGEADNPFSDSMSHYNPEKCTHPNHAGDMPPLFGNDGSAVLLFLTNRFSVSDIIGRTVIIHDSPDDFTTQPSGNSGKKIACGVIRKY